MKDAILSLFESKPSTYENSAFQILEEFLTALNKGTIRACKPTDGDWVVHEWVKKGILLAFRMGVLIEMPAWDGKKFFDKHTLPERRFGLCDRLRIVPGGTSVRSGAYLAPGVAVMPPAFINVGAYVDSDTLVDSHALVGSCAQIGKRVHLSAGAMIGGVLEPVGMRPVVIEDDVFVGGNTGIYEGIIVKSKAVLASGTIITSSTPIFDAVNSRYLDKDPGASYTIPSGAVLVPGSRPLKQHPGFSVYCPIIIKYRDDKTDLSVQLEADLRDQTD